MIACNQYLGNCLKILKNENKEICGDFNIDLLKIETVGLYQDYYNLLCSFGLLPHIQPTRIAENQTPSIIDNIFLNNLRDEITASNSLISFSEHVSQFISVIKGNNDYKNFNIYARNYSKFSAESFREDVSIQNFSNKYESVHDQFNDCADRHAPLKN